MTADPVQTGPVLYYQDPDEKPFYSPRPKKTADGRDYRAVHAGEDVSLAEKAASNPHRRLLADDRSKRSSTTATRWACRTLRRCPRRISMGMDYIPVYAGEDADGSSVKVSAGSCSERVFGRSRCRADHQ